MLRNILVQFWRNVKKNKLYTTFNIAGLAIGMAAFILIGLYVYYENQYDAHHPDADQIVQLTCYANLGGDQVFNFDTGSAPMGPALVREIDALKEFLRIRSFTENFALRAGERVISISSVNDADSSLFDFFQYEFLQGDPKRALTAPNSVVLSEETAHSLFDDTDPMGQEVVFRDWTSLTVTGVFRTPDKPTHLPDFPMIMSWSTRKRDDDGGWLNNISYNTYFKVPTGTDLASLQPFLDQSLDKHEGDALRMLGGENISDFTDIFRLYLRPLRSIHLAANELQGMRGKYGHHRDNLFQLGGLGLFILLIACLNYINLSTAKSALRSRMVGVSKTLGATRSILVRQFLAESVILSLVAFIIALLLVYLALPYFTNLLQKNLAIFFLSTPWQILALVAGAIIIGLLAGIYPAFVLSSYRPVTVLSGAVIRGTKGTRLRSLFVILQFAISIFLVLNTLIVGKQTEFMRTKDLGYDTHQMLVIRLENGDLMEQHRVLKTEIMRLPGVLAATTADFTPDDIRNNSVYHIPGGVEEDQKLFHIWPVDHDAITTFGLTLVDGREFNPDMATDSTMSIIINEAAAKLLPWENPVGEHIEEIETLDPVTYTPMDIIGVVKDFHFHSLHNEIAPMFMQIYYGEPPYLFFKLDGARIPETMAEIERLWKDFAPRMPLQYKFMDEGFNKMYHTELQLGVLIRYATGLAILVAAIGLFALAAFAAQQRTREIGIRKVLGATSEGITLLLLRDFLTLVGIAFVLAVPLGAWVMNHWLQSYAYRITLGPGPFLLAGVLAFGVAVITVGGLAWKVANANPVKAIRHQ